MYSYWLNMRQSVLTFTLTPILISNLFRTLNKFHSFSGCDRTFNVSSLSGKSFYNYTKTLNRLKSDNGGSINSFNECNIDNIKKSIQSDARKLQKHLQCTLKQAQKCITDNKVVFEDGILNVIEKCKICELHNISKHSILKNIWILSFIKSDLDKKLSLLSQLNFPDNASAIPLLKLDMKTLEVIILLLVKEATEEEQLKGANRLMYLAELLKKNELQITELASKSQFILTISFSKLDEALKLILSYGMDRNYLYNDMWPVRSSIEEIKRRLDILKTAVEPSELRPWMLHCKEETLARAIKLRDENRSAMNPFTSTSEYLCNRLEVDEMMVSFLNTKHPPLCRVHVHKLKEILDFLFAEGFTSTQICAAPRVLCHSLVTLQERLKLLQSIGYRTQSLMTLCKTKKQFTEFIRKLQHSTSLNKEVSRLR